MKKAMRIIKITLLSFLGFILTLMVVATIILYGRASSMASVKKKGDNLYTMKYKKNYHLDKALKKNIKSSYELLNFISDEFFFGKEIEGNINRYACSAFSTTTPDSKNIVGRNFDLGNTDVLSVYTNPSKGYKSISTVSTDMLGVGSTTDTDILSFNGRAMLLASPYLCVDGMNEKGLSAALLDTDLPSSVTPDTEKPNIIVTMAIRLLLDRAATVDEAVNLLSKYDVFSAHGWQQHIFISDKSGDSVIVEWNRSEMKVVKYNVCTNFRMNDKEEYAGECERFDILDNALKEKSTNTIDESMVLLSKVKQEHTQWSVIFNKTDFEVYYSVHGIYDKVYHLKPKDY